MKIVFMELSVYKMSSTKQVPSKYFLYKELITIVWDTSKTHNIF